MAAALMAAVLPSTAVELLAATRHVTPSQQISQVPSERRQNFSDSDGTNGVGTALEVDTGWYRRWHGAWRGVVGVCFTGTPGQRAERDPNAENQ